MQIGFPHHDKKAMFAMESNWLPGMIGLTDPCTAGAETGGASPAAGQQAPSESSGFQGDESFMSVPGQGATSSSSGFEEVPPADDVIAADDDDEAYD